MDKIFALLVTVDATDGLQTLGFSETKTGDGRYAILQKGANESSVYFEVDDQTNSAYDAIDRYTVDTDGLQLHLKSPVGKVTGPAVIIEFPESQTSTVESAMSSLFGDSDR
jgi:hypothetical protein